MTDPEGSGARETGGPAPSDGPPSFLADFISRNVDVIDAQEQAAILAMRVLVAGCGSVGGSVVEPLTRLGVGSLVLADFDCYERSNLNRQACTAADVGRRKAEVQAERARAINPLIETIVLGEGLTLENLESSLDDVTVVMDAIDPAMSAWVKYRLHQEAARRHTPVVAGADFGGKPTLYVFDYRRDPRPFYGRASAAAHRDGRFIESIRWFGYRHFPADFVPVILDRLRTGRPWPQVSYCTSGMGALASRSLVELALGRRVASIVSADVHQLARGPMRRLGTRLRSPLATYRVRSFLRDAERGRVQPRPPPAPDWEPPPNLLPVLEAIQRAPSPGNVQPWQLVLGEDASLRIELHRGRAEESGRPVACAAALGCAIEAAAAVARVSYQPAEDTDGASCAGTLHVESLSEPHYARAAGLVRWRSTQRSAFLAAPAPTALLKRADAIARELGAEVVALDRGSLSALADAVADDVASRLSRAAAAGLATRAASVPELVERLELDAQGARLLAWALRAGLGVLVPGLLRRRAAAAVTSGGSVLALHAASRAPADLVTAGRVLMRVWLETTRAGLSLQPLDAERFSTSAGHSLTAGADSVRPLVAMARIGWSRRPAAPYSRRLPLSALVCRPADT